MLEAEVTSGFVEGVPNENTDLSDVVCVEGTPKEKPFDVVSAAVVFPDVPKVKPEADDVVVDVFVVEAPKTNPPPDELVEVDVAGDPNTKPPDDPVELAVVVVPNTKPPLACSLLVAEVPKVNPDLAAIINTLVTSHTVLPINK